MPPNLTYWTLIADKKINVVMLGIIIFKIKSNIKPDLFTP